MTSELDKHLYLYKVALLQWNKAIKNVALDKRTPRRTRITYEVQKIALHKLQDAILEDAGVKRLWKRGDE